MGTYATLTPKEAEEIEEAVETTFGLERDLQRALRLNIEQLELGLKVVDGGKEKNVPSGRIDITANDSRGAVVVIELKSGKADRDAVAQVLSYMGDIAGTGDKPARGIVVAGEFSTSAISAARAVPSVELKKYSFKFSFEPVPKPGAQN
jgi:RecB family endonuclease NucS